MTIIPINSSLESEFQKGLLALKLKRFFKQRRKKNYTRLLIGVSICFLMAATFGLPLLYLSIVAFLWIVFGLFNLVNEFLTKRAERRLAYDVEFSFNPSYRASIAYDSTAVSSIVRMLPERKTTLTWEQFIGIIDSGEVLLLVTANPKLHWAFTRQEMGDEAYSELHTMAKVKLPSLESHFGRRNEWWQLFMVKAW